MRKSALFALTVLMVAFTAFTADAKPKKSTDKPQDYIKIEIKTILVTG